MNEVGKGCLTVILTALVWALLTFIWAAIACWLWGLVMVAVFGLPVLTYWQMFALIWLIHMIFPHSVSSSNSKN